MPIRSRSTMAILAAAVTMVGCAQETPPASTPQELTTLRPVAGDEPQQEHRESTEQAGETLAETRDEAVERMSTLLAELDGHLETLKERMETLGEESRAEWNRRRMQLHERRDEFASRIERLRATSERTWEDLAATTRQTYERLSQDLREVIDDLNRPQEQKEQDRETTTPPASEDTP